MRFRRYVISAKMVGLLRGYSASSCWLQRLQATKWAADRGLCLRRLCMHFQLEGRPFTSLCLYTSYTLSACLHITATVEGGGVRERLSLSHKFWLYVMPVTAFCLGTWQVYRLQWKRTLIAELKRRTMLPFIDFPAE